jgi:hypothetical protein
MAVQTALVQISLAKAPSTAVMTTIDRRCGKKARSGQLRSGPGNRALVVPTDRNVPIATILSSTRFPASGEIARSLIIAVSAMYPTKLLVANEHSSS